MTSLSFKTKPTTKFNLLRPFFQIPGVVKLILKRQRHYLGLTILALVDIILAVGLVTNASFFSQAVDRVVLQQELKAFSASTGRPPFSTQVYIFPSARQPMTLENAEKVAKNVTQTLSSEVGLPIQQQGIEVTSNSLMLAPPPNSTTFACKDYLGNVQAIYIANVAPQMETVEGIPLD